MRYVEIESKTLLRKMRTVDPWFIASRGINLYRGCAHDCAYCDGRAEKYRVDGEFGSEIQVKVNALSLLEKELGRAAGNQAELWPSSEKAGTGFIVLGGGVGDSYQEAEERYGLARQALLLFQRHRLPVHVITKSALVLRDADVLERMARESGALVSFSLSTARDEIARVFEPHAHPPSERLRAARALRERGIPCGIFLLPVIPFISDDEDSIVETLSAAAEAGAQWALFGGMTLKHGRQKEHFVSTLQRARPDLVAPCLALYPPPRQGRTDWGNPVGSYSARIARTFAKAALRMRVPPRVPRRYFAAAVRGDALSEVLVEHMRTMRGLSGSAIGTEREEAMMREIAETGTCMAYEDLLAQYSVT